MKWLSTVFFSVLLSSAFANSNPLSPGAPSPITGATDLNVPVNVGGTDSGYLIVSSTQSSNDFLSNFWPNGGPWGSTTTFHTGSYTSIWVTGTDVGYVATYINSVPGYGTAAPYAVFSNDNGASWTSPVLLDNTMSIVTPVTVSGTSSGFVATWWDSNDNNAYAVTSTNGTSWSGYLIPITTTSDVDSTVISSGNGDTFVATWQDTSHNAYASVSTDAGGSWGMKEQITTTGDLASDVWVSSNSSGFLAVWVDNSGNAYASFSTGNGSWSTPSLIASDVFSDTDVSVSGADSGFIVAWIGTDNNAYGSFSSDHGITWSTPAAITNDGSVNPENQDLALGYVTVAAIGNQCIFTWRDLSNNGQSSFSSLPSPPSNPINPPAQISGTQKTNNFGLQYELFNVIQWTPSSSPGVLGYNVYKNGINIAVLNASTLDYEDHNQKKGATNLYAITAFDSSGESAPISITIN